jgi:signal transduction histidine kinase
MADRGTGATIEGAIEVRVPALGELVTQLPWLSPGAASLLALARLPATSAWSQVRLDPGAVLLMLRRAAGRLGTASISFFPALLRDPAVLEGAVDFLNRQGGQGSTPGAPDFPAEAGSADGFVDWNQPLVRPVYEASLRYARLARRVAEMTERSDPDNAWVAGLLAPLGWLAACALNPQQMTRCLEDRRLAGDAARVQYELWGLDQAGLARRLLRGWRLPRWLRIVVGHLGLPAELAQELGAEPDLFRVVQVGVGLAQKENGLLHLAVATPGSDAAEALGLSRREQDLLLREAADPPETQFLLPQWQPPSQVPLLADLLSSAAESLRLRQAASVEQLEADCDRLQLALEKSRHEEASRLHLLKLKALAEFAAGAAHEINNPLAVISGQAQYLLAHEDEPAHQRSLQTIINQAQRVHQVLTEVLQFARPPRPQRQLIDVRSLIREVTLSLGDLALQRQIELSSPEPEHPLYLSADPRQISTALQCLLRNAIEAAPSGGWARLRLEAPTPERVDLIVEDNGSGPVPGQVEHLFDPFYSGRQAGRGRGMGLPTAWRLARQHDGDVRFDKLRGGPTRFVLSLPRSIEGNGHAATPAGANEPSRSASSPTNGSAGAHA